MKTKIICTILILISLISVPVQADTAVSTASSEAVAKGDQANAVVNVVTVTNGVMASSYAQAVGDIVSVFSQSHAEGKIVGGKGDAVSTGKEANAGITIETGVLNNGLNSITVTASANGIGNAKGAAWTVAWAVDPPKQVVPIVYQERPFSGFIFGHSDLERYLHFKAQLKSNNTNISRRAGYWMEVMAWTDYGLSRSQFEQKYINNSYYMNFTMEQYKRLQAESDRNK